MNRAASACRGGLVDPRTAMRESPGRTGQDIPEEQLRMSSFGLRTVHSSSNQHTSSAGVGEDRLNTYQTLPFDQHDFTRLQRHERGLPKNTTPYPISAQSFNADILPMPVVIVTSVSRVPSHQGV